MPDNDIALQFPPFPTLYTEKDKERKEQLRKQKTELDKIYNTQLTPTAWSKQPTVRRVGAEALETFTSVYPLTEIQDILPTGVLTPELARSRKLELEKELFELERKEIISQRVPLIQAEVTLRRLLGETVTEQSFLDSLFKDLAKDFTQEERAWITAFASGVSLSSEEELLSGDLGMTEEEMLEWYALHQELDPRFITSTVAFEKDLAGVTKALKDSVPAEEIEEQSREEQLESLYSYYKELAIEQGILIEDSDDKETVINKIHQQLEERGEKIFLEDASTGNATSANLLPDDSIWVENDAGKMLIARYDSERDEVVSLSEKEAEEYSVQIPFTVITEDGQELPMMWNLEDSSIWYGDIKVAKINEQGELDPEAVVWETSEGGETTVRKPQWWEWLLGAAFKGLEGVSVPITFVGSAIAYESEAWRIRSMLSDEEWEKLLAGELNVQDLEKFKEAYPDLTEEEWSILQEIATPMESFSEYREFLPGGMYYEQYEKSEWWYQLLTSLPFWYGVAQSGMSAMKARSALSPFSIGGRAEAVASGLVPRGSAAAAPLVTGTRAALAPLAGYEWVTGKVLYYVFGYPTKKVAEGVSEKYLQSKFGQSLASKIFLKDSQEFTIMYRIWKYTRTAPPKGASEDLYEQVARREFQEAMRSNPKFREEILEWLKVFKGGNVEEDTATTMLSKVLGTSEGASETTRNLLGDVLKAAEEKGLSPSEITSSFISEVLPEGTLLEMTDTLIEGLVDMGYPEEIIRGVAPEEAWAVYIRNEFLPETGETLPTPEEQHNVSVQERKIEDLELELRTVRSSLTAHQERVSRLQAAKALPSDIAEHQDSIKTLKETEKGILAQIESASKTLKDSKSSIKPMTYEEWVGDATVEKTDLGETLSITFDTRAEAEGWMNSRGLTLREAQIETPMVGGKVQGVTVKVLSAKGLPLGKAKGTTVRKQVYGKIYGEESPIIRGLREEYTELVNKAWEVAPENPTVQIAKDALGKLTRGNQRAILEQIESVEEELKELTSGGTGEQPPLPPGISDEDIFPPEPEEPNLGDSEAFIRIPTLQEVIHREAAILSAHPELEPYIRLSKKGEQAKKSFYGRARSLWESADKELKGDIAKEAGLRKPKQQKSKMGWEELPQEDKDKLAFYSIPDGSIRPEPHWTVPEWAMRLFNMEQEFEFYEEAFGGLITFAKLYTMRSRPLTKGIIDKRRDDFALYVGKDPRITPVRGDTASQERVAKALDAGYTGETPPELNASEELAVDILKQRFEFWEPYAKIIKFENYFRTDPKKMLKYYPDVKEAGLEEELEEAHRLYQKYRKAKLAWKKASEEEKHLVSALLDSTWKDFTDYMGGRSWGIVKNGYSPWISVRPSLLREVPNLPLGSQRGKGRFMNRKGITQPERMGTIFTRAYRYEQQMLSSWYLRSVWEEYGRMLDKAWLKLEKPELLDSILLKYRDAVEGYPGEGNILMDVMARVRRTAGTTVFNTMPYLPFRNIHQGAAFHYKRDAYFQAQLLGKKIEGVPQELFELYYDSIMNEMKGIKTDWLWGGEKTLWTTPELSPEVPSVLRKGIGFAFVPLRPLDFIGELADMMSWYPFSDDVVRKKSGQAYFNEAYKATEQFRKDKDIQKWLKDSGALNLRAYERTQALYFLFGGKVDYVVPGLRKIQGDVMASLYIADHLAAQTHFLYHRHERAEAEQGTLGKLFFELQTFRRQYWQRVYRDLEAFRDSDPNMPWEDRRNAVKNVLHLLLFGAIVSGWVGNISGRRWRAPYMPFDILDLEFGGFAVGLVEELMEFTSQWMYACSPESSEKEKKAALSKIITQSTRLGDSLIPWYMVCIDSASAYLDMNPDERFDRDFLRRVRTKFDETYSIEEREEALMTWDKKLQRAVFGGSPPDLDSYENALRSIQEKEKDLGRMQDSGRFYTLSSLGSVIETQRKEIPDGMFNQEHLFSPLVEYYMEYVPIWDEFQRITTVGSEREKFRKEQGVGFDTWLLFWEKSTYPAQKSNKDNLAVFELLWIKFEQFKITRNQHKHFASWQNLSPSEWRGWIKEHLELQ